jgi:hypothetical protein
VESIGYTNHGHQTGDWLEKVLSTHCGRSDAGADAAVLHPAHRGARLELIAQRPANIAVVPVVRE